ncbi:hypothetical protein Bpfe_015032 [Biomphalaria pfeifferi]|uniref:Dipeptidylpeptidase IV N-terminal domain-containing protein n=1 Tax=Biomphalaria pfeifferi TaxID=112525 RepID=A0AAD8F9Q3_BIOPF|nr:hypothetical protein Bpfe_015032 [Biomphalaria pfeifferi]
MEPLVGAVCVTAVFLVWILVHCAGVQFGPRVSRCQVIDTAIKEASGLAVSKVHHGVVYTHNDRGGLNVIFAVNTTDCSTVATMSINSASNWDWEDLSYGPCLDDCARQPCRVDFTPQRYCIYIADIGDHGGDGPADDIYVIREPPTLTNTSLDIAGTIRFNWTELDAETLMLSPDARLFIVSKVHGGHATIAQIPSSAWNLADRVTLDKSHAATLRINTTSNDPQGGDISPDGRAMLLVAEHNIYYYSVPDGDFIQAVKDQIPTQVNTYERAPGSEGIAWSEDGKSFFVLPEGRHPYLYTYTVDRSAEVVVG